MKWISGLNPKKKFGSRPENENPENEFQVYLNKPNIWNKVHQKIDNFIFILTWHSPQVLTWCIKLKKWNEKGQCQTLTRIMSNFLNQFCHDDFNRSKMSKPHYMTTIIYFAQHTYADTNTYKLFFFDSFVSSQTLPAARNFRP